MGLKNRNFERTGDGDFAVRLARHLNRRVGSSRAECATAAATYYKVSPQAVFQEMGERKYDDRKMPTGTKGRRNG